MQANQTSAAENDPTKPSSKPSAGGTEGVNELKFFYEDVVYRIQKKSGHIQFGLVVQNAEIEDEDEDDDVDIDEDKLKPGQVSRILGTLWFQLIVTPQGIEKVTIQLKDTAKTYMK